MGNINLFMEQAKKNYSSYWIGAIVLASVVTLALVSYDLLFSKPDHLQAKVIEKIYVPAYIVSGGTYSGMRRGNYGITTQKEEQWIAIVKTNEGDTLKVHCHISHYEKTEIGDVIKFNKYEGHLFHIQYFAHNEEE
ncbi:MAG: hypothetical protein ACKVOQ_01255 [Cyclobacteriaceae bacterium]